MDAMLVEHAGASARPAVCSSTLFPAHTTSSTNGSTRLPRWTPAAGANCANRSAKLQGSTSSTSYAGGVCCTSRQGAADIFTRANHPIQFSAAAGSLSALAETGFLDSRPGADSHTPGDRNRVPRSPGVSSGTSPYSNEAAAPPQLQADPRCSPHHDSVSRTNCSSGREPATSRRSCTPGSSKASRISRNASHPDGVKHCPPQAAASSHGATSQRHGASSNAAAA